MTCLQLCVLFNFQICGTLPPVFMSIFLRSRLILYKWVDSAFFSAVMANSKLDYFLWIEKLYPKLRNVGRETNKRPKVALFSGEKVIACTVNSLIATTSRNQPPPVGDHFVNNRSVSQSNNVPRALS